MEHALTGNAGEAFTSFFPGLEVYPILDSEVSRITGTSTKFLERSQELGTISRSIINEQRPKVEFGHFNFYDIFRFKLLNQLHLRLFLRNAIFEEILDELLDTFAIDVDQMLSCSQRRTKREILISLASHFKERESEWRQFWLLDGERLDPFRAAHVCLGIWLATFDASAQVIVDFKERWSREAANHAPEPGLV